MHTHGFSLHFTAYPGKLIVNELTDEKLYEIFKDILFLFGALFILSPEQETLRENRKMLKEIITSYIDTCIKCFKSKFPFLNGYWISFRDAFL